MRLCHNIMISLKYSLGIAPVSSFPVESITLFVDFLKGIPSLMHFSTSRIITTCDFGRIPLINSGSFGIRSAKCIS